MELYKSKHKLLRLSLDNEEKVLPVIYNSYHYTLWILSHKYKEIILYEIKTTTNFPTSFDNNNKPIPFTLPNITPPQLLDITNAIEVITYFGVDEYMLLNDFKVFDEIVDLITELKVKNERNKLLGQYTTYFDSQLVHISLGIQKINGLLVKYKVMPIYKISGISRKGFNKLIDRTRERLHLASNKITLGKQKKKNKQKLSKIEREYMETQLQEFFILLHERLNIERT